MNFKKIVFAGLMTFTFMAYASAQETIKLTIEDAVEMAIQNNIQIKQSRMNLDMLEKKNKYSWNSASPSFSLSAGLTDSLPNKDIPGRDKNSLSYSISGGIRMTLTPALATSMASAKLAYENGEITYEKAIRTVEKNVRSTFYQLLNMRETISSNQQAIDAAKRTFDANTIKYNRGSLDQLTLLNSQYNYESRLPALDNTKNSYQNYLDNMKQVLGIPLETTVELEGNLDDILSLELSDEILEQNLEEIPSIKTLKQNIKSTENSLNAARYSAYGPTFSLSYSVGAGGGIDPSSDLKLSTNAISLNLSVPLDSYLPWSNGKLNMDTLKTNLASQKMDLENAKTTAMISIKSGYNSIKSAQNQLKLNESNLKLAQQTYDMTLVAYNNGSKDLNALQTAQDNLSTARYTLQNQKLQIINAVMNLEDTLGLPFGTLNNKQ